MKAWFLCPHRPSGPQISPFLVVVHRCAMHAVAHGDRLQGHVCEHAARTDFSLAERAMDARCGGSRKHVWSFADRSGAAALIASWPSDVERPSRPSPKDNIAPARQVRQSPGRPLINSGRRERNPDETDRAESDGIRPEPAGLVAPGARPVFHNDRHSRPPGSRCRSSGGCRIMPHQPEAPRDPNRPPVG